MLVLVPVAHVFQGKKDLESAQRCPKILLGFVLKCAQEMSRVQRDQNAAAMDVVMSANMFPPT